MTAERGSPAFTNDLERKGKSYLQCWKAFCAFNMTVMLNNRKPKWQDLLITDITEGRNWNLKNVYIFLLWAWHS